MKKRFKKVAAVLMGFVILALMIPFESISVSAIKYTDGTTLCSNGCTKSVDASELTGETTFKVVLTNGTEVTATLVS